MAVTLVFFTTTNLFFLASMVVYNLNPLYTWPLYAFFLLVDGAYLSANLFKFLTGESSCSLDHTIGVALFIDACFGNVCTLAGPVGAQALFSPMLAGRDVMFLLLLLLPCHHHTGLPLGYQRLAARSV